MSLYDLLPSNATTLERDFSRAVSSLERVGPAVPTIRTAKRTDIPDSVVPWLIYEYGLNELLPYLGNNPRQALAEGIQWQRVRGTPQALKTALGWIGFQPLVEESESGTLRWAQFQLGLDYAPNDLEITNDLIGVSRLSAPVRSNLFRVYSGYDHRRFLLDDHTLSGGSWLCDHTGVYLRPDWPQLSFGRDYEADHDYSDDPAAEQGIERIHARLGVYEDRFTLDNSLLDEFWHLSDVGSMVRSRLVFVQYGPLSDAVETWQEGKTWETGLSWSITNSALPELKFAKAGIYLSDYATLDDTNTCFSARYEQIVGDGTFVLSEGDPETGVGILGQHRERTETREWLERLERSHAWTFTQPATTVLEKALHRHTQRVIDYDDTFVLSQHRLDEWQHNLDQQAISRGHTLTGLATSILAATWQPTTWNQATTWLALFGLERYLQDFRTGLYLSDSDPLSSTHATLGWPDPERFERDHFATATDNRGAFVGSQHTRSSIVEFSLYGFTDWASTPWAGTELESWTDDSESWTAPNWGTVDWLQGTTAVWGDRIWADRLAWNPTSLLIASSHETST